VKPLLLIPAYDEAATVGAVVAAARRHGPVLVIDDGSSDATGDEARAAGADVLRHARRLGKAQALRTGIAAARARRVSHLVTLDADGQHDPDDVPALLAARAARTIVVGTRLTDDAGLPAERLDAMRVAGFFASWASGLRLLDTQSGFRVYPIAVFDAVPTRCGGFVFETEILLAAAARGWAVREVPVRARPRGASRSRFRPVGDGVAIGAFVARHALARFGGELLSAAGEVAALTSVTRRQVRHAAMLADAAPFEGGPGWAPAIGVAAMRRLAARVGGWWEHPRRRRAGAALAGTLALPVVLPMLLVQGLAGRRLSAATSALVAAVYAAERLDELPAELPAEAATLGVEGLATRS